MQYSYKIAEAWIWYLEWTDAQSIKRSRNCNVTLDGWYEEAIHFPFRRVKKKGTMNPQKSVNWFEAKTCNVDENQRTTYASFCSVEKALPHIHAISSRIGSALLSETHIVLHDGASWILLCYAQHTYHHYIYKNRTNLAYDLAITRQKYHSMNIVIAVLVKHTNKALHTRHIAAGTFSNKKTVFDQRTHVRTHARTQQNKHIKPFGYCRWKAALHSLELPWDFLQFSLRYFHNIEWG